jgi:HAD superfamily hydrolase (TIGR01549 family)
MRTPTSVIFDLDGTLLDYDDDAWAETVRAVCAALGRVSPFVDEQRLVAAYMDVCSAHWRAAEGSVVRSPGGSASGLAIWKELWQHALAECGHNDAETAKYAVQLYRTERHRRYRLFADVDSVLTDLRARGCALALVTNGPGDTQRDKLAATGLARRFDALVISGEVGVAKPHPDIFVAAVDRLSARPDTVWHVGDSLTNDVIGARNAKLAAGIWLNRNGASGQDNSVSPTYEISTLRDLRRLINAARHRDPPSYF